VPRLLLTFIFLTALLVARPSLAAEEMFEIKVVDDVTGRGVPLVELETTNNVRYVTDSNGLVALREPGLFGQKVFFTVRSHGHEFAKDAFGYRGQAVDVTPGGTATLKIKRLNIAERLYRVTGADIYRDSVLLGRPVPIEKPLLNAQVVGSDSVLTAVYRGKIRWFWGDTLRPAYPLGLFEVPGAVSDLPVAGGLDPETGVNLTYFEGPDGFARATCDIPGEGPTWCGGLIVVKDASGRERMFASYAKIKPPLSTYARGIAEWNDESDRFEKVADVPLDAPLRPDGHPFLRADSDTEHVYFASPYPLLRTRATPEGYTDLSGYEAFTCLAEGSRLDEKNPKAAKLDRRADGKIRYSWKRNTPALSPKDEKTLVDAGVLKPGEGLLALRDRDTGTAILAHGGSVYWNEHRKRWVMIVLEGFGKPSFLGEVWYAEGDTPTGPWVYAVKVVTHDRQDFYNPKQHPMFDKDGGRTIFFEGTYTNSFSGNPEKTPRYEYNQVMYKLDLDDPRLALPVAIYEAETEGDVRLGSHSVVAPQSPDRVAFFAPDRTAPGTIPIYERESDGKRGLTTERPSGDSAPLFHGLPADTANAPAMTKPLYEFAKSDGGRVYSTQTELSSFTRTERPICLVWENPLRLTWAAKGN
jgi:hypothetical protein